MARDAVRPFIVGLLLVYLLDPPVRWLARHGVRRTFAILIVYVIAVILIIEFLNLTLAPLDQRARPVPRRTCPGSPHSCRPSSTAFRRSTRDSPYRTRSANGSTR